ncbi:MAG TPA: hypothetical protein VJQ82_10655 [Terriglobales bacterium]|nr:hypothetical protein [Terriglobales bacterium]
MKKRIHQPILLCVVSLLTVGCPSKSETAEAPPGQKVSATAPHDMPNPLIGRIWRIPNSANGAAVGSIYIFLPNGTLLETSCVETYRIATWTADKNDARAVHVMEDQRPAFDATVMQSSDDRIQLKQTLSMGNRETRDLTLSAVDKEFVCPDMKK